MYKHLKCPNCEHEIHAADINLDNRLAKCGNCHALFDVSANRGGNNMIADPSIPKEEIYVIPKGIEVLKMMSELEIQMHWRQSSSWFLLIFALFWNAIILPFAAGVILSGQLFMLLFLSLHLLVGVGLAYWVIAYLFNTTFIYVDDRYITTEHRPFRLFFKEHKIPMQEVRQLFVKKYKNGSVNDEPTYAYAVTVQLNSGEEIRIVKGISKPDQARYIEQEVEKFAHIADRKVVGEY